MHVTQNESAHKMETMRKKADSLHLGVIWLFDDGGGRGGIRDTAAF